MVDVSSWGIGAVLSHSHGMPAKLYSCAYYSRKFTPAEVNYDEKNEKLLSIKTDALSRRHDPSSLANKPEPILPDSLIIAPVRWVLMQ